MVITLSLSIGIDLGLKSFCALSDGSFVENPKFGKKEQERLARRQRALARRKRGSRSRVRAKKLVAKSYLKIRNQRLNFTRKLAKSIVQKYDMISYEKLNIQNMIPGYLARSIHDAAWGKFINCLECKAEEAGKYAIGIDPKGTSQICSDCGTIVPKRLGERIHECPKCGLVLDRDTNAAINIWKLGLGQLTQDQEAPGYGADYLRSLETERT